MDDFYADDFSDNFNPKGWTEKDWFLYLKKSDAEITRFAGIYTVNRLRGKTLEEICVIAGWPIPQDAESFDEEQEMERRVLGRTLDAAQPPYFHHNARAFKMPARTSRTGNRRNANIRQPRLGAFQNIDRSGNIYGSRRKFDRLGGRPFGSLQL